MKKTTTKSPNKKPISGFNYYLFEIFYPLIIYYFTTVLVMFLAKSFLGNSDESYMLCQILVGIVTLPVMYFIFYRTDRKVWPQLYLGSFDSKGNPRELTSAGKMKELLLALVIALSFGTACNNIIYMSPLVAASAGFAQANAGFFGSTLTIELIGSGILTPVLEEVTFRGILYGRLRRTLGWEKAIIGSAVLFAAVHFNMVQFVYALVIGFLFGFLLEKTGHLYTTIAAHMALNILAVLRNELGWLQFTTDRSPAAWIISILLACAGALLAVLWWKKND